MAIKLRIWLRFIEGKERHTIKRHTQKKPISPMSLNMTKEEMDKRCVMIKKTQYCRNLPKKAWQERYLSYNPTVSMEELMNMHTYEMFWPEVLY